MTITGKVRDGGLYFHSASSWLKALAPFEGQDVEVTLAPTGAASAKFLRRSDAAALRLAAIEVLLHRCCYCAPMRYEVVGVPMCPRCVKAFDRLAELVGMKTPEGA